MNNFRLVLRFLLSLVLVIMGSFSSAWAWPPEVAPELEFESAELEKARDAQADDGETHNAVSLKVQEEFKNQIANKCKGCRIEEKKDKYGVRKYRVTLKNKWYFEITLDPGLIEIVSKPFSDIQSIAPEMQRLIWGTASELGLRHGTAGHLNYGVESTFGNDSRLFYNFFVDFLNNTGLTEGILGYKDLDNAPHPESLGFEQRRNLRKILTEFDPAHSSIQDFSRQIYEGVYYRSTSYGDGDGENPYKYHSVNISSLVSPGDSWPRLELRSIPMQESARDLELLSMLFTKRIEYLKSVQGKIEYRGHLSFSQTPMQMVREFHKYVTESGLDWFDYRHFVLKSPEYTRAVEKLESSLPARAVVRVCKGLFVQ